MNCADVEILLAEYVDGTVRGEAKSALEAHLGACARCAGLARDAAGAVAFIERAAVVEAPPQLVTRILFEASNGPGRAPIKSPWARRIFGRWIEPVLQPRYAMGMAMTILSFAMLGRFSGIEVRQLKPSDLDPVKIVASADEHIHRAWERTVKYYENLRVVYEIQTQLEEWNSEQQPADSGNASNNNSRK